MLLDRKALAYASSALAASMMQAAFSFYYINVYLQRFHVSRGWFQVAQVGGAAVGGRPRDIFVVSSVWGFEG